MSEKHFSPDEEHPSVNIDSDEGTDLEELHDEGLGATIGEKDTFEPEEPSERQ